MTRRLKIYWDWPALVAIGAPTSAGAVLGVVAGGIDSEAWFAVFLAMFLVVLPVGVAASYWLSCRVMDRSGQPWAYVSFFVSLASWLVGAVLYTSSSGLFMNK